MTAASPSAVSEVSSVDATPQHPAAEDPAGDPAGGAAADTTPRTAPATGGPAPAPAPAEPPAADPPRSARRVDAGNTALLIGIIVGLIGSVSVLVGVPIFLLNKDVDRARDDIDALDAKIERLDDKMDAKFERLDDKMDAKFDELAKGQAEIDRKLTALIASLGKTSAVEASLAGQIPP